MEVSILEMLYVVLIVFTSIIWTLLIIVLLRVIKILWPFVEMLAVYNKVKQALAVYAHIPELIKEKVKEILSSKEK